MFSSVFLCQTKWERPFSKKRLVFMVDMRQIFIQAWKLKLLQNLWVKTSKTSQVLLFLPINVDGYFGWLDIFRKKCLSLIAKRFLVYVLYLCWYVLMSMSYTSILKNSYLTFGKQLNSRKITQKDARPDINKQPWTLKQVPSL